jgi:hypothetical protein
VSSVNATLRWSDAGAASEDKGGSGNEDDKEDQRKGKDKEEEQPEHMDIGQRCRKVVRPL